MPRIKISFDSGYVHANGERTVYASTWINRKKVKFHTSVILDPKHFDEVKGLVKKSHDDYSDMNLLISSTVSRIHEIVFKYRLQHIDLTKDLLMKEYKNASSRIDFHAFLQEAIYERRGELSISSVKQHYAMASKLEQFSPTLSFSQLDPDFMARFNRWMINTMKNEVNTRFNTFKNLKSYLNIAIRKRIITYNALAEWMPAKQTRTERVFLTEHEVRNLIELYNKNMLSPGDQKVLRHFLFMCFTGLRISDFRALEMEQIINKTVVFSATKTKNSKKELVKIPLPDIALRLMKDESPHRLYGRIFDTYSEQRMRMKIKEIVKVAHIQKDVSLHTGRHTFATMFLRKSRNIAVLQKLLGHSKIEQTMIYAHVLTEDIEQEMKNVFQDF